MTSLYRYRLFSETVALTTISSRDARHSSTEYAMALVHLLVCLTQVRVLSKRLIWHHATLHNSPGTLIFYAKDLGEIKLGHSKRGAKFRWGELRSAIFDQYLLCLRNGARQGRCYYERLIGSRMLSIECCSCQWPWVPLNYTNYLIFDYKWRPLFNAAKFGWRPLLECRAVTLPRRETRWNLQGCLKLPYGSQPLVGRSSPYCGDMWRTYCCLIRFFRLSIRALVAKI